MHSSMVTVGVDIRVLGPAPHGGIREYTEQILRELVKFHDVTWKLFYSGRQPLDQRPWMSAANIIIHETEHSNRLLWARTRCTGRPYIDRFIGGADVFFFPHFLLAATSPSCRRVMTWHDLSYESMPELLSVGRRFWHRAVMRPRMQARTADHIIAVSESTRRDLIGRYGIVPERVTTVHSGIDPSVKRASDGEIELFRARESLPRRFVFALGTREPRKNLGALVAAFERIASGRRYADLGLVIAGPDGWLEGPLRDQIHRSALRTRIRFVGQLRREERALWLSAATVLAYPSLMEGFGFPPLEAMACGTTVLASANSSLFETVSDAGLLVDPYSIDRLAASLAALLDDDALRTRMIQRGYARVAMFTWSQAAARTMDVLRSVLQ
ncbi:MAG TPA: glycosyltransferase family 1 protein [Candidatus Paceibacterota bacterium]|nr:glycosyltransferase family 1 protein [Candidatus Paceibacterota bacterium]